MTYYGSITRRGINIDIMYNKWNLWKPWKLVYALDLHPYLSYSTSELLEALLFLLSLDQITLVDLDPEILKLDPRLQAEMVARELCG